MNLDDEVPARISEKVKMAGFLEKKGKMKLVSPWKRYWFVLEERLLLYYKSQLEYSSLSPCRGSLNMGLVSTVKPGPAAGPCLIHIITRTQVVQLRAKDRAAQEEWLQALLDSMTLPLGTALSPSNGVPALRFSMDNIPSAERKEKENRDKQRTLPHKLMSGMRHGGSLDTAIWSRRVKSARVPSPNIPKGKMLERILGYVDEGAVSELDAMGSHTSLTSSKHGDQEESTDFGSHHSMPCDTDLKAKLHDENQNHDFYSTIDKSKKTKRTLSDETQRLEAVETQRPREESRFERIKSVISRKGKDKNKLVPDEVQRVSVKKRRSFLYKVRLFKKQKKTGSEKEAEPEGQSDSDDPLYDTIGNVPEPGVAQSEEVSISDLESSLETPQQPAAPPIYSQVQKPVFGSKILLSAQAMSELKSKLKSRESLERQEVEIQRSMPEDINCELAEAFSKIKKREVEKEGGDPPALPPRRTPSRARSPWHDVPLNNAPLEDGHYQTVRFRSDTGADTSPALEEMQDPFEVEPVESERPPQKEDDLTNLLAQLAEITTAPLSKRSLTETTSSTEAEVPVWVKPVQRRFSDPDYDTPRPHRPLNLPVTEEGDRITATEFLGKCDDFSETSSSPSMEPDSLEAVTKCSERNDIMLCGL